MQPQPPPPPPIPPPLSEAAQKMFSEQAALEAAQAELSVFKPFSLRGPKPSTKKHSTKLQPPSVDLSHVLGRHVYNKGKGSKGLKRIGKEHLLVDKPFEYARASLIPARIPYGRFITGPEPLGTASFPPSFIMELPKKKKGGKKSHKKSANKSAKKSHKKRTHRRRH